MIAAREELIAAVSGRRVAIVGAAKSLIGSGQGPAIDSRDAVIRINSRLVREEESPDTGSRTDLYYSGDMLRDWSLRKFQSLRAEFAAHQTTRGVPTVCKSLAIWEHAQRYWDPIDHASPRNQGEPPPKGLSTGVLAIFDCVLAGPSQIDIFGFDGWATPDRYAEPGREFGDVTPDYRAAEAVRLRILVEDYGVRPDKVLRRHLQCPQ